MLCIGWDMKVLLYYELLAPGQTVNSARYAQQLNRLRDELDLLVKIPFIGHGIRTVLLLHDNARPHIAAATKETIFNLGWEVLLHPAYSPDLTPSDFHVFRSIKHTLSGQHFTDVDDVHKCIDDFITSQPTSFFHDGINELPKRCGRC